MMENDEMIYTAIFQSNGGKITRSRYTGVINRKDAWIAAAKLGESDGQCLVALVPGDHPVHTYENVFNDDLATAMRNHDLYEITPDPNESVYEMT